MDLATLIGLIGCMGVIMAAILVGGNPTQFIDVPSVLIVGLGSITATLIKFPLAHFLGAMKVAMKAFIHKGDDPSELIAKSVELAGIARQKGMLALEGVEIKNEFLKRGIQLLADGQEPEFVQRVLSRDINLTIERHERSEAIFRALGDLGPAMGMIGTLVGLVQMLSSMDDPKSIGPAMAVALLTTLYGSVLANVIALPIADKLQHRSSDEKLNKRLILESIISIQEGLNPRVMEELLKTYLPPIKRKSGTEKAAA